MLISGPNVSWPRRTLRRMRPKERRWRRGTGAGARPTELASSLATRITSMAGRLGGGAACRVPLYNFCSRRCAQFFRPLQVQPLAAAAARPRAAWHQVRASAPPPKDTCTPHGVLSRPRLFVGGRRAAGCAGRPAGRPAGWSVGRLGGAPGWGWATKKQPVCQLQSTYRVESSRRGALRQCRAVGGLPPRSPVCPRVPPATEPRALLGDGRCGGGGARGEQRQRPPQGGDATAACSPGPLQRHADHQRAAAQREARRKEGGVLLKRRGDAAPPGGRRGGEACRAP